MGDKDFSIKQADFIEAYEVYKEAEEVLAEEKIKQAENVSNMIAENLGSTMDSLLIGSKNFYNTGKYDGAYQQTQGMRKFFEESLPEINALLRRCEVFHNQLSSDTYIDTPALINDNAIRNGGTLSMNFDVVANLKLACEDIVEQTNSIETEMLSIMRTCENIVDGVDSDKSSFQEAAKHARRVENYKESFQKYEAGIRALEFDMTLMLSQLCNVTDQVLESAGLSETELSTGIQDLTDQYNIKYLSEGELEEILQSKNSQTIQIIADQFIEMGANTWTDLQAEYIANSFSYAVEQNQVDRINTYVNELVDGEYGDSRLVYIDSNGVRQYKREYTIQADTAKISQLMGYLSPTEQGKAYYTLNRIGNLEFKPVEITTVCEDGESGAFYTVETTMVDGEIQISFLTKETTLIDSTTFQQITIKDINSILTPAKETTLEKLGFEKAEIEAMRLSAITDADVQFLNELSALNYAGAFDVNPELMSANMNNCLTQFIFCLELNDKTGQLESCVNGLLKTNEYNNSCSLNDSRGAHIENIKKNLLSYIDIANTSILLYDRESEEFTQLIDNGNRFYKLFGLFSAVDNIYNFEFGFDNLDLLAHSYAYGYCHSEITGLSDGDGEDAAKLYRFNLDIIDTETGESVLDAKTMVVDGQILNTGDLLNQHSRDEMEKLREERDMIVINTLKKEAGSLMDKVFPGSSGITSLIVAMMNSDLEAGVDAQGKIPFDKYMEESDTVEIAKFSHEELTAIGNAYFEYQNLTQKIYEKDQEILNSIYSQTSNQKFYFMGAESEQICGEGVILPHATYTLHEWEQNGIEVIVRRILKDKYTELENNNEGKVIDNKEELIEKNWTLLEDSLTNSPMYQTDERRIIINGGDVRNISGDDLSSCLDDIEKEILRLTDFEVEIENWILKQ